MIEDRVKADIAHGHKMNIAQLVQSMDEPATEDIRAKFLLHTIFKAVGKPGSKKLRHALATLRTWEKAGGQRKSKSLKTANHDVYTPAIELMDAWWPDLLRAEFQPMLGRKAFTGVERMIGFGGTDFAEGWYGYVSKDLRRVFGLGHERGRYSQAYCGSLPHRHLSVKRLRSRCRAALLGSLSKALKMTPKQLYGGVCPSDPQPACSDQNRWTYVSAIQLDPFPYQNRPTFQQVVVLKRHLKR
jgi:hypothetical protein